MNFIDAHAPIPIHSEGPLAQHLDLLPSHGGAASLSVEGGREGCCELVCGGRPGEAACSPTERKPRRGDTLTGGEEARMVQPAHRQRGSWGGAAHRWWRSLGTGAPLAGGEGAQEGWSATGGGAREGWLACRWREPGRVVCSPGWGRVRMARAVVKKTRCG